MNQIPDSIRDDLLRQYYSEGYSCSQTVEALLKHQEQNPSQASDSEGTFSPKKARMDNQRPSPSYTDNYKGYDKQDILAEERTAKELEAARKEIESDSSTSDSDSAEEKPEPIDPIENENTQAPVIGNDDWEFKPEETVRRIFENWAIQELADKQISVLRLLYLRKFSYRCRQRAEEFKFSTFKLNLSIGPKHVVIDFSRRKKYSEITQTSGSSSSQKAPDDEDYEAADDTGYHRTIRYSFYDKNNEVEDWTEYEEDAEEGPDIDHTKSLVRYHHDRHRGFKEERDYRTAAMLDYTFLIRLSMFKTKQLKVDFETTRIYKWPDVQIFGFLNRYLKSLDKEIEVEEFSFVILNGRQRDNETDYESADYIKSVLAFVKPRCSKKLTFRIKTPEGSVEPYIFPEIITSLDGWQEATDLDVNDNKISFKVISEAPFKQILLKNLNMVEILQLIDEVAQNPPNVQTCKVTCQKFPILKAEQLKKVIEETKRGENHRNISKLYSKSDKTILVSLNGRDLTFTMS